MTTPPAQNPHSDIPSAADAAVPVSPTMPKPDAIIDDKSPICIPFILERLRAHSVAHNPQRPFIIGLNGVQGVGKTTLVKRLAETLRRDEGLETLVCSIDDFYLARQDQVALAASQPGNKLVQVRGEPGTHDIPLLTSFFHSLLSRTPTSVPHYDKSQHSGKGDRAPPFTWPRINQPDQPRIRVLLFEGWCVGFRALPPDEVARRHAATSRTLQSHDLAHLHFVNERLAAYDAVTDLFDAFVHIDAADTEWVYDWRLEQEIALRAERGSGMTDDEVIAFVDAYYPAYELFTDKLRNGLFSDKTRAHLRLVVGKDRKVKETFVM
ncbi:putative Uridine/cytidine kinase [Xylariaceae sp. FL0016]|nr:putative Uridine/cytidine kinase [Xylariaceae sp. FL0016]